MRERLWTGVATVVGLLTLTGFQAKAPDAKKDQEAPLPAWARTAGKPKPLSRNVEAALKFLADQQTKSGGWDEGGNAVGFAVGGAAPAKPNVADTSLAALAFIRCGNSPKHGPHADVVARAVNFVCDHVEQSKAGDLMVTDVVGTTTQRKIGTYIDTFAAALFLSEVKGRMPDEASEKRASAALDKVIRKLEANQKGDGSWDNKGWAPIVSHAMACKALNRSKQAGAAVDAKVLEKATTYARNLFDPRTGAFNNQQAAGVSLYAAAASFGAIQDSVNTGRVVETRAKNVLANPASTKAEKAEAKEELQRFAQIEKAQQAALAAVIKSMSDPRFVNGFGSNGGEEFISFMSISESLVVKGGNTWKAWDEAITKNLYAVQNRAGSWSGSHCITGKTFCTAASILTLVADRVPLPMDTTLKAVATFPDKPDKPDSPDGPAPVIVFDSGALAEIERLSTNLLDAEKGRREELIDLYKESRGANFTQALATVIPRLEGELRVKARDALAERLTRMTADTLRAKLSDNDKEVRCAAALACAMKEDQGHVADLVAVLEDPEPRVAKAAHVALVSLTGKDFGSPVNANRLERNRAIDNWKAWSKKPGARP